MSRQATRIAVVTGATGGIGRWIARGLAQAGFSIVAIGRNADKLADLREWLAREAPECCFEVEIADLSLVADATAAGRAIAARHQEIAILVNNAGIFTTARRETSEAIEAVIATNHLAPFALTAALAGVLAPGARIVNVGSVMSEYVGIDADDLQLQQGWNPVRAYGRSKLALAIATFGWAHRLGFDITVNVVHPGSVATGIVRDGLMSGLAWRAMTPFLMTPEQGAAAPLHVALSPALDGVSGRYFRKLREAAPNRRARDPRIVDAVWQATVALAGHGPA